MMDNNETHIGYVVGNVRLVLYQVNMALGTIGLEQLVPIMRTMITKYDNE